MSIRLTARFRNTYHLDSFGALTQVVSALFFWSVIMDIANLKPVERTIEIVHPATGEPIGIRVGLVSLDDDRLRKVRRAITDERMRLEQRGKSFKSEDIEENARKLLYTAVIKWEWYSVSGKKEDTCNFNGEVPELTQKNFYAVIDALPWLATQLNEAIGETKGFFDKSPSS